MTDIEQKALALVNEVQADWNYQLGSLAFNRDRDAFCEALCRAIEQHEAFRREVSDALHVWYDGTYPPVLDRFIIPAPKPDPLVDAMHDIGIGVYENIKTEYADTLRADLVRRFRSALDARGFEIREKGQ